MQRAITARTHRRHEKGALRPLKTFWHGALLSCAALFDWLLGFARLQLFAKRAVRVNFTLTDDAMVCAINSVQAATASSDWLVSENGANCHSCYNQDQHDKRDDESCHFDIPLFLCRLLEFSKCAGRPGNEVVAFTHDEECGNPFTLRQSHASLVTHCQESCCQTIRTHCIVSNYGH